MGRSAAGGGGAGMAWPGGSGVPGTTVMDDSSTTSQGCSAMGWDGSTACQLPSASSSASWTGSR